MVEYMTNFRAEDMPSKGKKTVKSEDVEPEPVEEKKAPAKKPVAHKTPAKKAAPKKVEVKVEETKTDTESGPDKDVVVEAAPDNDPPKETE